MSEEGNLYQCKWVKIGRMYSIQATELNILVSDKSFDNAVDKLISKIGENTGDMEAQIEFNVPRPKKESSVVRHNLKPSGDFFKVNCNSVVPFEYEAALHNGVCCSECLRWKGLRNKNPIVLSATPTDDIAIATNGCDFRLVISDKMKTCFHELKMKNISFIEAIEKNSRSTFYELHSSKSIRANKPKGSESVGEECKICGIKSFYTAIPGYPGRHLAVERSKLDGDFELFMISAGSDPKLVFNKYSKQKVASLFKKRSFRLDPIFVV